MTGNNSQSKGQTRVPAEMLLLPMFKIQEAEVQGLGKLSALKCGVSRGKTVKGYVIAVHGGKQHRNPLLVIEKHHWSEDNQNRSLRLCHRRSIVTTTLARNKIERYIIF